MTLAPQPNTTASTVPGGGRTWVNYMAYFLFAAGIGAIGLSFYFYAVKPQLGVFNLAGTGIGVASIIGGLTALDRIPRSASVGSDFVEIRYLLSHVKVPWSQLRPPVFQRSGFIDFSAAPGTRGVIGGITVTTEQARMILAHPACPHLALPPAVVSELKRLDQV